MATSPPQVLADLRARYRASADALERVRLEELAALARSLLRLRMLKRDR